MVTQGYPDWSRVYQQQAGLLANEGSDFSAHLSYTYGPFYVGSFQTIRLFSRVISAPPGPAIHPIEIDLLWADTAAAGPRDTFSYYSDQGLYIADSVGVMAPWLSFTITELGPLSVDQWQTLVWGLITDETDTRPADSKVVMSVFNHLIPGASTVVFLPTFVTTGPAKVLCDMLGPSWTITAWAVTGGVEQFEMFRLASPAAANLVPFEINLPPYPLLVSVDNIDAGGHDFSMTIVIP